MLYMYFLLSGLLLLFPCSLYGQLFVLLIDFQLSDCLLFSLWSTHCSHYGTTDSCSQSRTIALSMYKYPACNALVLQFSLLTGLPGNVSSLKYQFSLLTGLPAVTSISC